MASTDVRRAKPFSLQRPTSVLAAGCLGTSVLSFAIGSLSVSSKVLYVATAFGVALLVHDRPTARSIAAVGAPLLLLFWWMFASNVWTIDTHQSSQFMRTAFLYAFCGWNVARVLRPNELHRILAGSMLFGLVVTLLDLVGRYSSATAPGNDGAPGWHGLFIHKNELGFFCVIALITFGTLPHPTRRSWLPMALAGLFLVGSHSATALASVAVVIGIVLLRLALRRRSEVRGRMLLLTGAGIALLAATGSVFNLSTAAQLLGRDGTLTGRSKIWAPVWELILRRPYTGYGWNAVWSSENWAHQFITARAGFEPPHAHDAYLDLLLQIGLPGLVLFVAVIGRIVSRSLTGRKFPTRFVDLALLGAAAIVVTSVSESLTLRGVSWLLIVMLSTAVGVSRPAPDRSRASSRATLSASL